MGDGRHHVNLGWHLGKSRVQSDFNVKGCRRDGQLQRHTVLRVHRGLTVEDYVRVELSKFVDLDVGHCSVIVYHLLPGLEAGGFLARKHIIVHASLSGPHLFCLLCLTNFF